MERPTRADQGRHFLLALLGVLVLLNLGEYLTPVSLRVVLLAALLPVVGAVVLTVRQTAVLALLCVVSMAVAYSVRSATRDQADEIAIAMTVTVGFSLCGLLIASLGTERQEQLQQARSTAEAVGLALLRPLPLRTSTMEVHGIYLAADEFARVGGDFYEVLETPYGTRVLIADVCGKGLEAINAGAAVLSGFRVLGYEEPDLGRLAERMELTLDRYNEYGVSIGQEERHVTALLLEYGPGSRLALVNCGHLEPFMVGPDSVREVCLGEAGLPLGFGSLAEDGQRTVVVSDLSQDVSLLLCTDGVTEARDHTGEFYPLADRLRPWGGLEPRELVRQVRLDLAEFVGKRLQDDATILVVSALHP